MGLASGLTLRSDLAGQGHRHYGPSGPPDPAPDTSTGWAALRARSCCDTRPMRVAILGFGLIGGSIARALAEAPDRAAWSVIAWSPTGEGPGRAAADGVVETAAQSPAEAIDGAQLVVL